MQQRANPQARGSLPAEQREDRGCGQTGIDDVVDQNHVAPPHAKVAGEPESDPPARFDAGPVTRRAQEVAGKGDGDLPDEVRQKNERPLQDAEDEQVLAAIVR